MNEIKIHYKNCTPEDIQSLKRFEPELQKVVTLKGLASDVCWKPYVTKPTVTEYRFFMLYAMTRPATFLGGDYGEVFLQTVSREEFFDSFVGARNSTNHD